MARYVSRQSACAAAAGLAGIIVATGLVRSDPDLPAIESTRHRCK
jgi:hypothetical protein